MLGLLSLLISTTPVSLYVNPGPHHDAIQSGLEDELAPGTLVHNAEDADLVVDIYEAPDVLRVQIRRPAGDILLEREIALTADAGVTPAIRLALLLLVEVARRAERTPTGISIPLPSSMAPPPARPRPVQPTRPPPVFAPTPTPTVVPTESPVKTATIATPIVNDAPVTATAPTAAPTAEMAAILPSPTSSSTTTAGPWAAWFSIGATWWAQPGRPQLLLSGGAQYRLGRFRLGTTVGILGLGCCALNVEARQNAQVIGGWLGLHLQAEVMATPIPWGGFVQAALTFDRISVTPLAYAGTPVSEVSSAWGPMGQLGVWIRLGRFDFMTLELVGGVTLRTARPTYFLAPPFRNDEADIDPGPVSPWIQTQINFVGF